MRKARSCTHICRTGVWRKLGEEPKLKGRNTDKSRALESGSLEEKKGDLAEDIPLGKMAPLCTSY
ncbi:hypothetical protein PDIG_37260 [Penicillium digitatum PHI26]|uniref:Uncharacterized protein n=2 Tax=Penicillium digitatum TaxID=36651 RepID=K9FYB3_PEND2|nr:hypothetical protein PDIP_83850 [Penicillium digitatum Pd1]EKV05336.1 hypothetical protein PDIP_83850 [Penicillium digitatum Pd1]EKV13537.1 hypothetical protein PDIG_37260 [Penicillium digitatum PHI26]